LVSSFKRLIERELRIAGTIVLKSFWHRRSCLFHSWWSFCLLNEWLIAFQGQLIGKKILIIDLDYTQEMVLLKFLLKPNVFTFSTVN
jgi:hypothetical protein